MDPIVGNGTWEVLSTHEIEVRSGCLIKQTRYLTAETHASSRSGTPDFATSASPRPSLNLSIED
jgi:hypothetical protein